jgi:hypothetical protein
VQADRRGAQLPGDRRADKGGGLPGALQAGARGLRCPRPLPHRQHRHHLPGPHRQLRGCCGEDELPCCHTWVCAGDRRVAAFASSTGCARTPAPWLWHGKAVRSDGSGMRAHHHVPQWQPKLPAHTHASCILSCQSLSRLCMATPSSCLQPVQSISMEHITCQHPVIILNCCQVRASEDFACTHPATCQSVHPRYPQCNCNTLRVLHHLSVLRCPSSAAPYGTEPLCAFQSSTGYLHHPRHQAE